MVAENFAGLEGNHPAVVRLDAAVQILRGTAAAIPTGLWGDRPWQRDECADQLCPCIVVQGDPADWRLPTQHVARAETPEHAAWIALLHPGSAPLLAAWLEDTAEFLRDVHRAHGTVGELVLANTRHQLAMADLLLAAAAQ